MQLLSNNRIRRARPLLGTFVEIEALDIPSTAANAAIDAAFEAVAEVEKQMNYHDPASDLSRLNREGANDSVEVGRLTFSVLSLAAELHEISNGIFDVTAAPNPKNAGFHAVRLLDGNRVRFEKPGLCIDLGGIAKGFAVDQGIRALQGCNVPAATVNAGGDLRMFGPEPFPVAIRHPKAPAAMLCEFFARNCAVATSAHYFSTGSGPGPIFDPRSGCNPGRFLSVTVRARLAAVADALTKVVMLAGEDALPVLDHFGAEALIVESDETVRCTAGWQ